MKRLAFATTLHLQTSQPLQTCVLNDAVTRGRYYDSQEPTVANTGPLCRESKGQLAKEPSKGSELRQ
eukprot:13383644-Alexandrium_andersonii.AAC.1